MKTNDSGTAFPLAGSGNYSAAGGGGICACLTDSVRAQKVAIFVAGLTLLLAVGEWVDFSMVGSFEA